MRRSIRILASLVPLAAIACNESSHAPAPAASATVTSEIATAAPSGAKPPAPEAVDAVRDGARAITGNILVEGRAMATLTELTDTFGPRLTGSDAYARAAQWAADRFRAMGIDATLETFPLEHQWTRGEARGSLVAPRAMPLHVEAIGWTRGGKVRGEVVKLDDVSSDAIAKRAAEVKGKIAYFDRDAYRKAKWYTHPMGRLMDAGAIAVVVRGKAFNASSMTDCETVSHAPCAAPAFSIGAEDGSTIERLLDAGPVTLELSSTATLGGPVDVPNVVAEIKGRETPGEMVLVGAHFDSWDLGSGAQDNGSGTAQVMEAARAIRALATAPRRTMRFLLWGGEEEGLFGSRAYVKAHAADLDKIVAYLNTDYGASSPVGWDLDVRDDAEGALKPLAKKLLGGLGADKLRDEMHCDTDHCPFWTQGVLTLNLDVEGTGYMDIHHLASDTVDKVKEGELARGAAVVAVTGYALAEIPERIAGRATHAAVAKKVKAKDMVSDLVESGVWTR